MEIEEYKAKKEAVKKVETKRSLTHQPSRTLKSATTTKRESQSPTKHVTKQKPCEYVVSDTLVVREVWVQQAMMLIQQVRMLFLWIVYVLFVQVCVDYLVSGSVSICQGNTE